MINIELPEPDFSFEDKAQEIINNNLQEVTLLNYIKGVNNKIELIEQKIESEIQTLYFKGERLICIVDLLNYLNNLLIQLNNEQPERMFEEDKKAFRKGVNKIKYILYSLASNTTGYDFDKNAFTNEEVSGYDSKIDEMLSALETLKMGQSALGEEIQELKDDLNSLKNEYILGKKTWRQKATGIFFSFVGKKGSDMIWDAIKPHVKDFVTHQGADLINKLLT